MRRCEHGNRVDEKGRRERSEKKHVALKCILARPITFPCGSASRSSRASVAVRTMRYPQLKDPKYREPTGLRGAAAGNATWIWGLNGEEYERHADVWPLNPDGDLLATMMIESVEGLKNVDKIAELLVFEDLSPVDKENTRD
jgi:hypothetical protein